MNLIKKYEQAVLDQDIEHDCGQKNILIHLQRLADELMSSRHSWLARMCRPPVKGIYLHGPVGVGKTWLIDLFYQCLPCPQKARFHFHHFMQQVDHQLRQLQGEKNPLQKIAANLAKSTRILCFDEFLVHDVAYAMILADLLQALLAKGVILVITSNTCPDELYLNGVQRARFLPAIALIKQHCEVLALQEKKDYRLGKAPQLEAYMTPLGEKTDKKLEKQFAVIAPKAQTEGMVTIQNREIPYKQCAPKAIWFDFSVICDLPRSQLDYLEIAERFETIFVSDIPVLTEKDTIAAILFIHFIDVLYDRGIRLILSAAVELDKLYEKGEMFTEFKRTLSRLHEMQSVDYVQHHPRRRMSHF